MSTDKTFNNTPALKELTPEDEIKMFEHEYKLFGKYDKQSSEKIRKLLASLGTPVPTLKDIYKKTDDDNSET